MNRRKEIIKNIEKELKILKNNCNDIDCLNLIIELERILLDEIYLYRKDIDKKYIKDFKKKPATVKGVITTLPKGINLRIEKMGISIKGLNVPNKKMKLYKDISKDMIGIIITPIDYTRKFIIRHWYLLLLLLLLLRKEINIPNINDLFIENYGIETSLENVNETEIEIMEDEIKEKTITMLLEEPKEYIYEEKKQILYNLNYGDIFKEKNITFMINEEILEIISNNKKSNIFIDIINDFVLGLEQEYKVIVKEYHPNIIIVHNEEEYITKMKEHYIKIDDAKKSYKNINSKLEVKDMSIIWPELEEYYFENVNSLMKYILFNKDEKINNYCKEFSMKYYKEMDLLNISNELLNNISSKLKVSSDVAKVLVVIYMTGQYGLAPFTHGMTLALPG